MSASRPQRSFPVGPQSSVSSGGSGNAEAWRLRDLKSGAQAYLFDLAATGRSMYRQEKVELALRTFGEFLTAQGHAGALAEITADHVRAYLVWLRGERPLYGPMDRRTRRDRGLSARTLNDRLIDVKSFFKWLAWEGHIDRSPARQVKKLPEPEAELAVLAREQVAALIAQPNRSTWAGYRDYTILSVLYDTGLRVSELTGLRLENILWAEQSVRVWGKGQKQRTVPLGMDGRRALVGWMQRRGECAADQVMISRYGQPLDRRRVARIVAHYGRLARITGVRMSPHTLRHTFATHYLEGGGDLFTLQIILGHRTLDMVRRYAHLADRHVRLSHRRFSPLDMLRRRDGR